ncbi:MAG: hypothetical protein JNL83_21505 [Myxococcales bacterium]|nr:hypothetical protein [Myxococcales bacterium]
MVARGPGAVGCAHCRELGADKSCAVCTHLVCERCAADWATCSEPSGRTFRIGRVSGSLIDVDPTGRYGLVKRRWRQLRLVDLRSLAWLERDLPSHGWGNLVPRVTSDGRVLRPEFDSVASNNGPIFSGIGEWRPDGGHRYTDVPQPMRATGMSAAEDWYWYVTDTELVALALLGDGASHCEVYEPLPRKVVQAVWFDPIRQLLASGTWGEIAIHRVVSDRLVLAGRVKTTGDTLSLQLGGGFLMARVRGGDLRGVTVWKLHDDFSVGPIAARFEHLECEALARDGRYVAVGMAGGSVIVQSLLTAEQTELRGHTDDVTYLGFAGAEQLLVTADDDHRVIVRPRTRTGYATALLPVDLAEV